MFASMGTQAGSDGEGRGYTPIYTSYTPNIPLLTPYIPPYGFKLGLMAKDVRIANKVLDAHFPEAEYFRRTGTLLEAAVEAHGYEEKRGERRVYALRCAVRCVLCGVLE